MREELKPCPCCNGPAEMDTMQSYRNISSGRMETGVAIYCTECGVQAMLCRGDLPDLQPEEVISIWNTRAKPQGDVPRDEEGRDAYQIIAEGNRQAMLRRAGVKDRSREPLLGPPSDMLVSRILLEALPDIDPKQADQLAVKINDAIPADDNHKALVEALGELDAAEKSCPAANGKLGGRECPKCGAGLGQNCGPSLRMMDGVVRAAKALRARGMHHG